MNFSVQKAKYNQLTILLLSKNKRNNHAFHHNNDTNNYKSYEESGVTFAHHNISTWIHFIEEINILYTYSHEIDVAIEIEFCYKTK